MSKKEKLIKKLKAGGPFTFDEAETLLESIGYSKRNKGRTSGSRVAFVHNESKVKIIMHKPHPQKELKDYQIKQLKDHLEQEGSI